MIVCTFQRKSIRNENVTVKKGLAPHLLCVYVCVCHLNSSICVHNLLRTIRNMSNDCRCEGEIELLNHNLKYLSTKEKLLKKKYQQLLIENLQKDIIIRDLKKKIESKKYNGFIGEISTDCVDSLNRIGDSVGEDSTFVRTIMNDLYDQKELKKKTVDRPSKDKTPISPERKKLLVKLFEVRLKSVKEEKERTTRENSVTKLIRNVLDVANRKKDI